MRIICVGQVEDPEPITVELAKQTIQPDDVMLLVDYEPAHGVEPRRIRIAHNHNALRRYVEESSADLVFQVEGDSVLPANCLESLIERYRELKADDFGYISGIQIGRHGIYCVGAWHFSEDLHTFKSVDKSLKGIQLVDTTGFYCLLAPKDVWLKGQCSWNGERWGPDSNFGLSLKEKGYKIYVDMDLPIGHKTENAILYPEHISTCNVRFYQEDGQWKYKTS